MTHHRPRAAALLAAACALAAPAAPAPAPAQVRWAPPLASGKPEPKPGYSSCEQQWCEFRIVSTSITTDRWSNHEIPVLNVRVAIHNRSAERQRLDFGIGLSDVTIDGRSDDRARLVKRADGPLMGVGGGRYEEEIVLPGGGEVMLDYSLRNLGPDKTILNLLYADDVRTSGITTDLACPYYAAEERMLAEGRLAYLPQTAPPAICKLATAAIVTARDFVGHWDTPFGAMASTLTEGGALIFETDRAATRPARVEFNVPAGAKVMFGSAELAAEGASRPLGLSITPDAARTSLRISVVSGELPAGQPRTFQFTRRAGAAGSAGPVKSLNELAGRWQFPWGAVDLKSAGGYLYGEFEDASGNLTQAITLQPLSDQGARHWGDVRVIGTRQISSINYAIGADQLAFEMTNPKEQIAGLSTFVAKRIAASGGGTNDGGATGGGTNGAPATGGDYAGGWGNGQGSAAMPAPVAGTGTGMGAGTSGGSGGGTGAPATGGMVGGGAGGFVGLSKTFDASFDGAKAARDSELHVFVTVRNTAGHDAPITPGNFIPKVRNADGEWIVSREVYRAGGDVPVAFRPVVPPGETVRLRFVFRPDAGSAPLTAFSLGVFEGQTHQWDVSAVRLASLRR